MKPRIVILSAFASPLRSGAEACAEEVAARLGYAYDITILTAKMRSDLPREGALPNGVKVRRVGFGISFDKWLFPFFAPFAARSLKPDLLHAVLETFAGLALRFCRVTCPGIPSVLTLQTTNSQFLRKWIIRRPTAVTAISDVLVHQASRLGRHDVRLIPNGIDGEAIAKACARTKKVPGRVLFVGRLEKMKGVDTLLLAFRRLAESGQRLAPQGNQKLEIRNQQLHIVGRGSLRADLEAKAKELGIADRVTFAGYKAPPAVYDEFAEAEIFCGLSRSEALGNVFLEAQAAGCAVIGTNVGGIPDIVQSGKNGWLVAPENVNEAAEALGRLLFDAELRAELSKAAQTHAAYYDWADIAKRYAAVYDSLLSSLS